MQKFLIIPRIFHTGVIWSSGVALYGCNLLITFYVIPLEAVFMVDVRESSKPVC
jgi:hypothetical protein